MSKKVAVIGCGKLGLPLITCLAKTGFQVLGIDSNNTLVEKLKLGQIPWNEPNLSQYMKKYQSNINFSTFYDDQYNDIDTTFIIVPTPSTAQHDYSIDNIINAINNMGEKLSKTKVDKHLIVIVSTVMPGDTEGRITEALKLAAGINFNQIEICYSPEFIALGSVIHDIENPSMILIGESNLIAGNKLSEILLSITVNNPKIFRLSLIEAEIAKIAINSYVTTKVSFANQISEICEKTPGASAHKVLEAIGSDSRIGTSYFKPGTSYGGPCFPRDNKAFSRYANKIDVNLQIPEAADQVNRNQISRLQDIIEKLAHEAKNILIVGLAYKKDTNVYEESLALKFISDYSNYNYFVYDDYINSVPQFNNLVFIKEGELKIDQFDLDVAILFVDSPSYEKIPEELAKNIILIDYWGTWDKYINSQHFKYYRIGNCIV